MPANLLNRGGYSLKFLTVQNENRLIYQKDGLASFSVADDSGRDGAWMGRELSVVQPPLLWETTILEGT